MVTVCASHGYALIGVLLDIDFNGILTLNFFKLLGTQGQANNSTGAGNIFGGPKIRSRVLQEDLSPDERRDQGASQKALLSPIQNRLSSHRRRFPSTRRQNCEPVRLGLSG